jgi:hypothetical protein
MGTEQHKNMDMYSMKGPSIHTTFMLIQSLYNAVTKSECIMDPVVSWYLGKLGSLHSKSTKYKIHFNINCLSVTKSNKYSLSNSICISCSFMHATWFAPLLHITTITPPHTKIQITKAFNSHFLHSSAISSNIALNL